MRRQALVHPAFSPSRTRGSSISTLALTTTVTSSGSGVSYARWGNAAEEGENGTAPRLKYVQELIWAPQPKDDSRSFWSMAGPHHTTGTVLLGGVWGPWPPDELFEVEEEVFHLRRPMVSQRRVNGSNKSPMVNRSSRDSPCLEATAPQDTNKHGDLTSSDVELAGD